MSFGQVFAVDLAKKMCLTFGQQLRLKIDKMSLCTKFWTINIAVNWASKQQLQFNSLIARKPEIVQFTYKH